MATQITPRLIELTYEAVLKSYWRRNALRKFLLASNISNSFVSAWPDDESKRDLLDRLFEKLQTTDKGKAVISLMARSLSEQSSFPDLRNWEDSTQKIQDAQKAAQELKVYLKQQDEEAQSKKERSEIKERARIERELIQRSLMDKRKLQQLLDVMHSRVGTQEGGYEFEEWFYQLLNFCEIQNRKPYKTDGRQIDGSLTYEGTTYLVELKFTKDQSGAQEIDSLKAKVNKMADNTMGIMVSISGYSSVAISEASGSKTTLIIMDASHLYLFLSGAMSFGEIISRVRRHASQTGEAYLPTNKFHG
ncbi:restriction endonuclease [Xenorhabdus anantnagensis]|uniref:Restriction endonuclease n=1 Tax=Xenorhabdus anantnagensis TaxID=3025875 RepID=A0ABT5LUB1_9GAMM|nr:restriction endonuclease [Xenorhabdus anantnagensis]MDC9598005.1 restriction endonuclease [Xenorhabdus anantnagensis]